jgi:hypothetical protein
MAVSPILSSKPLDAGDNQEKAEEQRRYCPHLGRGSVALELGQSVDEVDDDRDSPHDLEKREPITDHTMLDGESGLLGVRSAEGAGDRPGEVAATTTRATPLLAPDGLRRRWRRRWNLDPRGFRLLFRE